MNIAILGSTGSIGTQTLEVVRAYPELLKVEVLTAQNNWELLAAQAAEFEPAAVVIANEDHYGVLRERIAMCAPDVKVYAGVSAVEQAACGSNVDTVVTAVVGFAGLTPTVAAIRAGKRIALANKETLVVGGDLVMPLSREFNAPILPVDSEHSAILQCLVGERQPPRRVIITASGGALRDVAIDQLQNMTAAQALQHPCWAMGAKITIDSATMVNKGFEVMEAAHLFSLSAAQIDVVIHPQSIIHSFVEFVDGALKAQMGMPDMKLPIQYALTFPDRRALTTGCGVYNPWEHPTLSFLPVDPVRYPCLELAFQVMRMGGVMPCVLNAANEVAVEAFLRGRIGYNEIYSTIDRTLDRLINLYGAQTVSSVPQLVEVDAHAREVSKMFLQS